MATHSISSPDKRYVTGTLLVLASAVAFSSKAVMVKLAYADGVDAETLLTLRMVFAAPFYLAITLWLLATGRIAHIGPRDFMAIFVLGIIGGYLPMWLDFAGLVHVSAGLERVILFVYPTMVVLISAVLFGRRIGRRELLALILSYAGVILAVSHEVLISVAMTSGTLIGCSLIFASALTYAGYLVASGRLIPRLGVLPFTAMIMLMTSVAAASHYLLLPHVRALTHLPGSVYGLAMLMAVIATVLPSFMLSAGIQRIGSNRAAMLGMVGPVSTLLLGYIYLGERISALQLAGTLLVLAGVMTISVKAGSTHAARSGEK